LLLALASSAEAALQQERLLVYPMAAASAPDGGDEAVSESDCFLVAKETLAEPAD